MNRWSMFLVVTLSAAVPAAVILAGIGRGPRGGEAGPERITSLAEDPLWPPWSKPPEGGARFTIAMIDNAPDLHGDVNDPQLVVFFAGNQFMAWPDLLAAFRAAHPEVRRIFAETLPPGILADQMEQGALVVGNLRITVRPDVYAAGKDRIDRLQKEKGWFSRTEAYARNRLAILVYRGNPKHVASLKDLGRTDVTVSMPNPKWEGVANRIIEAYRKAGGQDLVDAVMKRKVDAGTTFLTHIHHRQTPLRVMLRWSDAGPVWYTEAKFQESLGHPVATVEVPEAENVVATYVAARLKDAPHAAAADAFMDFLASDAARAVYRKYGFLPPQ